MEETPATSHLLRVSRQELSKTRLRPGSSEALHRAAGNLPQVGSPAQAIDRREIVQGQTEDRQQIHRAESQSIEEETSVLADLVASAEP